MELEQALHLIAQFGFPIFVAAYLLIRIDKLISKLVSMEEREHEILGRIATHIEK